MFAILGDTYEIREKLKALGCYWLQAEQCWVAPDEARQAEGQRLADEEPWRRWREFMDTLSWAHGAFTKTVWEAGLNGCSRGIPIGDAKREIRQRIEAAGKPVTDAWIDRNVGRAYDHAEPPQDRRVPLPKRPQSDQQDEEQPRVEAPAKPEFAPSALQKFTATWSQIIDSSWLADRSPIEVATAAAGDFLAALYEPGERVVVLDVFASQGQWLWSHEHGFQSSRIDYEKWDGDDRQHAAAPPTREGKVFTATGPQGVWYLCNPVDGEFRQQEEEDKLGRKKWSRRWEPCVKAWRYFVFESDDAEPREWVAAIAQLPLPIAAIYTSGGGPTVDKPQKRDSVHVLVRVDASSKAHFDLMRETAKRTMIPLGADPQCMSAVRLTRLPGCVRELDKDGKPWPRGPRRQKLLFLDPKPTAVPLIERTAVRDTREPWIRWVEAVVDAPADNVDPDEVGRLLAGLAQHRASPWARRLIDEVRRWQTNP